MRKRIAFFAESVDYREALAGDICEFSLEEKEAPENRSIHDMVNDHSIRFLSFSANYEFSSGVQVTWSDGEAADGGKPISALRFTSTELTVVLGDSMEFHVQFELGADTFSKASAFLSRHFP